VIPNYFVAYENNAAPLSLTQKFHLSFKTLIAPATFAAVGITAEIQQDRLIPLRRQPTPNLRLPSTGTIEGVALAYRKLTHMIAKGNCPAAEAQVIADLLKAQLDLIELYNLEKRLHELEKSQKKAA
jgi:hypothetical protein